MNTTKEYFLSNVSAVIVDGDYLCYPAESDEGDVEICHDWENGGEIHVFDDESFNNLTVPSPGVIRLTSISGVEFDLTPLREFDFSSENDLVNFS